MMAAVVALVMGGTQALSRALFSQMIPKGREAEYFGVYEISDKGTSWLAPLFFGLALQFTGNYRLAILRLLAFFLGGLFVLLSVNTARAAQEAAKPATLKTAPMISVVIPIHNEEPAILPLYDRLTRVLESIQKPYEIIFIDDASTDRSFELLANLVETDGRLKVIRLRRNFGQTAALAAGFDEAQGDVIISLDGDLQHDPGRHSGTAGQNRRGLRYCERMAKEPAR